MADLNVNFVHPTDGRIISVTVDSTMTGQEAVSELIANDFVPASGEGYNLAIKGGNLLENNRKVTAVGKTLPVRLILSCRHRKHSAYAAAQNWKNKKKHLLLFPAMMYDPKGIWVYRTPLPPLPARRNLRQEMEMQKLRRVCNTRPCHVRSWPVSRD